MIQKFTPIDLARWSGYENKDGPVLKADFSFMKPADGIAYVKNAEAFLKPLVRAEGGEVSAIGSDMSNGTRHVRIAGATNCAILINWAANHKPALLEKLAKTEILPEVMEAAQARIANGNGAQRAPEPDAVAVNGHKGRGLKPAIHFAKWSYYVKGEKPLLVATFSALGNRQAGIRYGQAREFVQRLDAVDQNAITFHDMAASFEIKGRKACQSFVDWVAHNMPQESAAIAASGIPENVGDIRKTKYQKKHTQQLPLADNEPASWAAKQDKTRRGQRTKGAAAR